MIINKITYEQLNKIITPKINFVLLKFDIDNSKRVGAKLVALTNLDEYLQYMRENLCIVIYDRKIIENFQSNYFFKLKDILKSVNNLNRFELKNILVMLTSKFPTYNDFNENEEQILEYITLIRQSSKEAQDKVSTLQQRLFKLIDFALIKKDVPLLQNFTEEQVVKFLKKNDIKEMSDKYRLRKEFLQSQDYKDSYSVEYIRLAQKNYIHYLYQIGLPFLIKYFFKNEDSFINNEIVEVEELAFSNNKMFEDKKQEMIETAYKELYKINYLDSLEQGSPSKAKKQDSIKIYSRIQREFNTINLYSLDYTYTMNNKVKSIFTKLYSEIGKHTLNTLDTTDEEDIINDIYQETLYQEDLLSMFIQHNEAEDKKLNNTLKKLIKMGITDNDWQERAREEGIEIPNDFLDESELYSDIYEDIETFQKFIHTNKLKDVDTKHKKSKVKHSSASEVANIKEPVDIDNAHLTVQELDSIACNNFFNYVGIPKSTKIPIVCTCSRPKIGEIESMSCSDYLKDRYIFNEKDLLEFAQEAECQIIIKDLLKNDNVEIKKNLLLNPYIEDSDIITIVKEDTELYLDYIICNIDLFNENIFLLIFENVYYISQSHIDDIFYLDIDNLKLQILHSPLVDEYILEKIYEEENDIFKIALLKNEEAESFIEDKLEELSLSKNIEILKLIASIETTISEEVFVNLYNSQNEEVLELLEEHEEYCQKYCPQNYNF